MRQNSDWNKEVLTKVPLYKEGKGGIETVVTRIIRSIIAIDNGYLFWVSLSKKAKERFKYRIRMLLREELLGKEFMVAIAQECITKGGYPAFDAPLYEYVLKHWYHGDHRLALLRLNTWLRE